MSAKGFFSNWIVKNLIWAIVFVAGFAIAVTVFLNIFTQHNREITVPDMVNLTFEESAQVAQAAGVRVVVADSVYVRRLKPGVVFSQLPKAGSQVKKGRKIALTTNALVSKKVSMPSLVGFSMRQAKAELMSKGLTLGKLIYMNDMATNNVLQQLYDNRPIEPGTQVESGAVIDLVLGLNGEDFRTVIPNVLGMKYLRAVDAIHENYLNIGTLNFDSSVKNYSDSMDAVVYSQRPAYLGDAVRMGGSVSLFLTVDENKMPQNAR